LFEVIRCSVLPFVKLTENYVCLKGKVESRDKET